MAEHEHHKEGMMPEGFEMCRKKGGRIVTKKVGMNKYMHICYMDGKSYPGEVQEKKPKED